MAIGYKEQTSASVPTPSVGEQYTFIDSFDNLVKRKDSSGTVTVIEAAGSGVSSFEGRTGVVVSVAGDYSASEITNIPAGDIVATNVQAAINELDNEKLEVAHEGAGGAVHPVATDVVAGFLSPSDKTKLDSIASGATLNQSDAFLLARANHTGTQVATTISNFDAAADARITVQKGNANGLAPLDATSKVPIANLPASLVGTVAYQSAWNANINSPALSSGSGTKGFYYVVSVAGSTSLDTITDWKVGDWAIFNGTIWEKVDNTDAVASVNGYTGAVTLVKADVGLSNVDNTSDLNKPISTATQTALNLKADLANAINELTGEVTAGPGGGSQAATVSNAAVLAKVLTGLSEAYGLVTSSDSILQALSKLVYSQNLHAMDINSDFVVPDGYNLVRAKTVLTGSAKITLNGNAKLTLI
jgi:stage V sporulation protein SpoVS